MKQVLQHLRSGEIELAEVPCPRASAGHLLIQTRASLISAGTERMIVEFSKASLVSKARQNPERVRQVLEKIKADGLLPTLETVFAKLDEPMPLGYCNAGVVIDVGAGVTDYKVGDRVASNGRHAEIVNVPVNLCAKIPDGLSDEEAAFTVLSSIGLQGIRLINPTFGESVAVFGLGLIGLVSVQLLKANGCRVIGIDMSPERLELARQFGAETVDLSQGADPVASGLAFSNGQGVDGVLITAAAKTNAIMHQAAQMSRKRGRIVLVGVVGLELDRADFYNKELTFQVSCSYGPGRYDPLYEDAGQDYPYGFVRWTEQRNLAAILQAMASGQLDVKPLITTRFPNTEAVAAYQVLTDKPSAIGIIMDYPEGDVSRHKEVALPAKKGATQGDKRAVVAFIGAGGFTRARLMPALEKTPAVRYAMASSGGVTSTHVGRKFGFAKSTTDYRSLLADGEVNTVFITTRHDLHASMVVEALAAKKHVFVEKPLAVDREGMENVRQALAQAPDRQFMVGFNRRFSPHAVKMKELLRGRTQPLCMTMLINAGKIPMDHWAQDPVVGGGRIIGEGCHWIDLLLYLAGCPITAVQAMSVGDSPGLDTPTDKMTITLRFADGSIGTLHYYANGHKSYAKEQMEVYSDGRILHLNNFRLLRGFGFSGFKKKSLFSQDKGHNAEVAAFIQAVVNGDDQVMPTDGIFNVTEATFAAIESMQTGQTIELPLPQPTQVQQQESSVATS